MLSKTVTTLYAIVIVVMAMATFFPQERADSRFYGTWWFTALWALLTALAIAHMVRRRMRRASLVMLHGAFAVILCGALITRLTGEQSSVHLREGVAVSRMDNGSPLPFTVTLQRFQLQTYSGTEAPSDFISTIEVSHQGERETATISMNNIYNKAGVRLYQSGYDPDMRGTYLSVNKDPWGIPVTYLGYALLLVAMIWMLTDKKLGFRKALRKIAPLTVLLLTILPRDVVAATSVPRSQAEMVGRLYIRYGDRICPMQTYAIDLTKKIHGARSYDGKSAEEVMCGLMFYPGEWNKEPLIKVKSSEVRKRYGLGRYASVNDFMQGGYILGPALQEAYQGNDDKLHQEVKKLDEKLMLIMETEHYQNLYLLPRNGQWYAEGAGTPMSMLRECAEMSDWKAFSEVVQQLHHYQQANGGNSLPSRTQLLSERIYNSIPFATILFMVCLTVGLLSIMQKRWIQLASRAVLLLSWLTLTLCLALRWIVSQNIPMTNGYETMLFLAWVIMLATISAMRAVPILTTFGLILSGFCLLVSHLSQLDPQITPLMPVLQSPLLSLHVSTVMIAYALLAITAICSLWAVLARGKRDYLMSLSQVFLYPAIAFLSVGIFLGAVWANVSWGAYWSWDPKETWALITMMVYAVPLHGASLPRFRGALFYHLYMVMAFCTVIITYFGVNYLLGGMHSYA